MGLHVYGVVRSGPSSRVELRGVRDGDVRFVTDGALAAAVTDVPEAYEPTEYDAQAHLAVLTALADPGPVLPLRLGTVAPDEDAVCKEVLVAGSNRLRRQLRAREGLVEVHVDVADDEQDRLREIASEEPELRARLEGHWKGHLAGRSLEYEIRVGELVARRLAERRDADAEAMLDRLTRVSRADGPRGSADGWVMRWAFLLPRSDLARFDRVLTELYERYGGRRRITRVGPLPVLSFAVDPSESEVSRWGW